jgi:hypothetical protein
MNLTDYKRKKGELPAEDLGVIYVFKSNREGVSEITEHLIWEIRKCGRRIQPKPEMDIFAYKLKESPYEVTITEGEIVSQDRHLFTGIGDCWSGSTFASMNRSELEKSREKEFIRIEKEYLNKQ